MKAFSNEEIKTVILDHINWNTKLDASGVLVSVDNGLATLTGTVKSYAEKQEAFESARHVSGVRAVNNEIIIFNPEEKRLFRIKKLKPPLNMPWHGILISMRKP